MELFFDTETSGLYNFKKPSTDKCQPFIVQLAFILSDEARVYSEVNMIIDCEGKEIEPGAENVHKISAEMTQLGGLSELDVMTVFNCAVKKADRLVCHNFDFDIKLIMSANERIWGNEHVRLVQSKSSYCTMKNSMYLLNLPGKYGKPKWPKLVELHKFLFNEDFFGAHDALADIRATRRCYYELLKRLK
jgi:DNA polymerase III subunit epsilon